MIYLCKYDLSLHRLKLFFSSMRVTGILYEVRKA